MKRIYNMFIRVSGLLSVLIILFISGCDYISSDVIKSGEYFRQMIHLDGAYGVYFSSENTPIVTVEYRKEDDTLKTAVFQLDGYDSKKDRL